MKIKAEKITSGKSFIILITAAVLMTAAGAVMLILALKYYISAKNTAGETQETQTVYNSAFGETVPLEKEKVEEIVNYEQPVSFPPTKLLDVPYINQRAKYPTGCESISAVMALIAKTPFIVIVLMSAWIPAPPLESLPAMVSAVFVVICFFVAPMMS